METDSGETILASGAKPVTTSANAQLIYTVAGAIIVILVMILYHAFWWNRVIGMHAGCGYFATGIWFLENFWPYRDYFGCTCPFGVFYDAAIVAIFGKVYWSVKAFGVIERLALATFIYLWLRRLFRPGQAAFAAIVTTIAGSGSFTDPLEAFHQRSEMYAIVAGLALSYSLDMKNRMYLLMATVSGCFAALCLCTKQSVGLIATVITPVAACLAIVNAKLQNIRRALIFLGGYSLGFAVIFGGLVAWLAYTNLLQLFCYQVFVQGPAGKASHPLDFVIRFGILSQQYLPCLIVALIMMPVILSKFFSAASDSSDSSDSIKDNAKSMWIVFALAAASVTAGILRAYSRPEIDELTMGMVAVAAIFKVTALFCIFSLTLYCFYYLRLWILGRASQRQTQFFVFAAVAFGTMFASSLSFPLTNEAMVPGLGLVVAATLEETRRWKKAVVYGCWALFIFGATDLKCSVPFGFETIFEQAGRKSNTVSVQPELIGFILPKETVDFLDGTVDIIKKNTKPGDTIFTYPEFQILYALSNRRFPTFSPTHIMDITSDKFAIEEAARILKNKPAVLVYIRDPDQLKAQESGWRFGKPSGNRAIIAACETLAKEYTLARTFKFAMHKKEVMVFVRPPEQSKH